MIIIVITRASLPAKKRILTVCVKLFLEQGYKKTKVSDIVQQAKVSNSIFQNIFRAKDGVLTELVKFMYENQFSIARGATQKNLPPVYLYAIETSIQIALTELNENLREIYLEAYTHKEALEYIHQSTTKELYRIFGSYQPEWNEDDFYAMDIGTAGMMRAYMARPCDEKFSLEKKLYHFLSASLSVYSVPKEEQKQILDYIAKLNIRQLAWQVMLALFQELAMHFEFSLSGILPEVEDGKMAAEKAEVKNEAKTEVEAKAGANAEGSTNC